MRRLILSIVAAAASVQLFAQIDPTVEVTQQYDVKLGEIYKPSIPTDVSDSLHRFDISFDYSIFDRPYEDLYEFTPYETIQLETLGANRTPVVYAKVGTQVPFIPSAEIYAQTKPKDGHGFGVYGRHNSFVGALEDNFFSGNEYDASRMENTLGADYTFDWESGVFMLDAQYNYDRYKYESDSWDALHGKNDFSVSASLGSAYKDENSIYYDVNISYKNTQKEFEQMIPSLLVDEESQPDFARKNNIGEGILSAKGYVGASFDVHRIYIDINVQYASFSGAREFSAGVVEFSPIYQIEKKWITAKVGVKFGSVYGFEDEEAGTDQVDEELQARNNIFPDIDAKIKLIDGGLWLHGFLTGGNELNNYSKMIDECPLVVPHSDWHFGKRNLDSKISLESLIAGRLGFNAFCSWVNYENKLFYAPVMQGTNVSQIRTGYIGSMRHMSLGGELFWKSQEVNLGGSFAWNKYTDSDKNTLTELPEFTASGFFRYNFRERIIASLDCHYSSAVSGNLYGEYTVPQILDMDANVNFLLNKNLAVFVKCGNLLDRRNQYVPLYLEPGRNIGGGICLNF